LYQVIKCWDDVLLKMSEGEKLMVVCPFDKAYGPNGMGRIPPYTDIAFEIELLKVVNPYVGE
jgi:FKBP-type peptidyl-prolyl cis-trans isomerase